MLGNVSVCMHACACLCVCVCVLVRVHVCVRVHVSVCKSPPTCVTRLPGSARYSAWVSGAHGSDNDQAGQNYFSFFSDRATPAGADCIPTLKMLEIDPNSLRGQGGNISERNKPHIRKITQPPDLYFSVSIIRGREDSFP